MCCLLISSWQMAHGFSTDTVHFVPFIKIVSASFLYYKDTIFLFGIKYYISYRTYFHLCKYTLFLYENVITNVTTCFRSHRLSNSIIVL